MSLRGALTRSIRDQAPVSYTPRNAYPTTTTLGGGGQTDLMGAYGSVGTLFAVANRLANATSAVEWHLHRKARGGVCDECEAPGVIRVEKHAALTVWNKPNPFMPRQEFVEAFQLHLDLTGEANWVTGTVGGLSFPTELWCVRPDRISPVPDPKTFLSGYVYRGPEGERIPLDLEQVIQLKMPNPLDPYRGLGPVQSILVNLDSAKYSAEWNRNFFVNSAVPGGIIELPESLSDEDFKQWRMRWDESHRGVARAHRVAILEAGGKWVDRTISQRDMQFAELSQLSDDKIREAFGFPKFAQGIVQDVNRASADASNAFFAEWLIVPRLERIKGALNNDFLPLFGSTAKDLSFAYCSPVPEDRDAANTERTSKATAYATYIAAGVDPEDAAAIAGLPPMRTRTPAPVAAPTTDPSTEDGAPA